MDAWNQSEFHPSYSYDAPSWSRPQYFRMKSTSKLYRRLTSRERPALSPQWSLDVADIGRTSPRTRKRRSKKIEEEDELSDVTAVPLINLNTVIPAPEPLELSSHYLINRANAHFFKCFAFEAESRPFIVVRHDVNAEDVTSVMQTDWRFVVPRIALFLVSDVGPMAEWSQPRQLDAFKCGLIKAANTTHMWIFTNGLNTGIAQEIGDAVAEELSRRRAKRCHKHPARKKQHKPPLTLVGLAREDLILGAERFTNSDGSDVNIQVDANKPEEQRFELNPDHTHYIIVRDDTVHKTGINQYTLRFERVLACLGARKTEDATTVETHRKVARQASAISMQLPLVAVLIQGDFQSAKFIFDRLQKELPILVFEGTGGLANLIAFVYNEVQRRAPNVWDAEFIEEFVKPELTAMICAQQPMYSEQTQARNAYRDRILEIVRLACHKQQGAHLTVVHTRNRSCDLEKLDQVLLKALFKSQRAEQTVWYSQLKKDLQLTIDWNSPKVALVEVFQKDSSNKFQVDSGIFMEALLREDREEFIDIFLRRQFQLSKFLSKGRLKLIFQKVLSEDFFFLVCWMGALGNTSYRVSDDFIEADLNWLIELCTGLPDYVSSEHLSMAAAGMCTGDETQAERKALVILALWAVFTHRRKLTKILWKHSEQPIHLALIISTAYARLMDYARDPAAKAELEESSREFSEIATGILDLSWATDAGCRAYDILSEESSDWNEKTAVELAAQGKNMMFLAHPCCQKWITNLFMGRITVRDMCWGICTFPQFVKIQLCAFFILPMYLFIRFKDDPHQMEYKPEIDEDDEDFDFVDEAPVLTKERVARDIIHSKARAMSLFLKQRKQERENENFPPLWKMIYLMWSAPITKFWTFQMFYILYLLLFSVAVLLPSCGYQPLDLAVCIWTFLIAVETCRRTYVSHQQYKRVPLALRCFEILFMFGLVGLYGWSRVLKRTDILSPYSAKVLQCFGLLYSYYRQIFIYLPISPTLGPLLYRIKYMVSEDFINFMRMALLVMISGGIAVQAMMYPDHPWNWNLARMTVYRAVFSLFLTPVTELGDFKPAACPRLDRSEFDDECLAVGPYSNHLCPLKGFWTYAFSIQYLILLKIILMTLLYALFSNTARRIEAASDNIWKFQRYQLVIDFKNRLCLPPPLNIISYILVLLDLTIGNLFRLIKKCCCTRKDDDSGLLPLPVMPAGTTGKDSSFEYWRQISQDYWAAREESELEEKRNKEELERQQKVLDEVDNHRAQLASMRAEMKELNRLMLQTRNYLAEVKHSAQAQSVVDGVGTPGAPDAARQAHFLAKSSPYPATKVLRFPVPDKYVPWEVMWLDYDPIVFTKPSNCFSAELQPYIDEDVLQLKFENQRVPKYQWNGVFISPAGIITDRKSWIVEASQSVIYLLEPEGVPRNPYGRTGLRGKGGLCRWGPNHFVLFVISRWQTSRVHLVGGKGLEVALMRATRGGHYSLPGDFVPGEDLYVSLATFFKSTDEVTLKYPKEQEHIKGFFQSMIRQSTSVTGTPTSETTPTPTEDRVRVEIVDKGYMDDPLNTDNCWKEVELWSVHYTPESNENISAHFDKALAWHLVTEDLFPKIHSGQAALLSKVVKQVSNSPLL
ncbi:transient receptor potential cation channel subfamily M member 2-like isoform X2 [Varroa jacobsoni]|uniref:transient receptor potential cation channel subfamily M member 2-like isoform X2 n=1 Tax=Varroa jacobsoni TaxID=62625 RepID=UPI000BF7BC7C|nr:transient receptor potential cation channel subfamily M member 2-like isoform X2 [Varroa jacobsoni]